MAHSSCNDLVGYIVYSHNEQALTYFLVSLLGVCYVQRWQSLNRFSCKKAKVLPISLAKVPMCDWITVGRNFEPPQHYDTGLLL